MAATKDKLSYVNDLLADGAEIAVDSDVDSYEIKLPEWFDEAKFKRAQTYFKENFFAMFLGKLCGLLTVLAVPSIIKILIHTRQTENAQKAYKRYLETILHTLTWYYEDLTPNSAAWKSVTYTRKIHAFTNKRSSNNNVGIISQKDMAITQFGFMGFIVIKHKFLGVQYDKENMDALVHFWRVIGYMIGIQDRFNLCTDSLETTMDQCEQVANQIVRPALTVTGKDFNDISNNLIDGLWCFNPFLNHKVFIYFLNRMAGVEGYTYWNSENKSGQRNKLMESFSIYNRVILFLVIVVHESMLKYSAVRWYMNTQQVISTYIITYFPFLAFYKFGIKNSYVRILK